MIGPTPGQCRSARPMIEASNALRGLQFRAKLNLMEYRGIRYTIRVGIERGQWFVAIHPDDIEMKGKAVIFGKREDAELDAHRMIDRWLDRQRTKQRRREQTRA